MLSVKVKNKIEELSKGHCLSDFYDFLTDIKPKIQEIEKENEDLKKQQKLLVQELRDVYLSCKLVL